MTMFLKVNYVGVLTEYSWKDAFLKKLPSLAVTKSLKSFSPSFSDDSVLIIGDDVVGLMCISLGSVYFSLDIEVNIGWFSY